MANNLLNFFKRLFVNQRQEVDIDQKSQKLRLAMILKASKQRIWIYDMARCHYLYLSDSGKYEEVYNLIEFSRLFNRDDYEVLSQALVDVSEGKEESSVVRVRSNTPESERIYEINISVAGRDKRGNVSSILGIQHDITNEVRKQHQVNQLLMRYHTVFNTSLLDMVFYDKNGVILDINDKACQAFGIKDREQVLKDKFLLKNNPMYSGVDLQQMENTRSTTLVDFSEYQDAVYQLDRFGLKGKMYYDSTINPIRNAKGELEGAYMCGRDITEMVDSVHRQREGAERVRRATQHVQAYIDDPYCGQENTGGFWKEFLKGLSRIWENGEMMKISGREKIFIISGQDDPVGRMGKGPVWLWRKYRSLGITGAILKLYPNMRHEILNETDKEIVYKDILCFIQPRYR